MRLRSALLATLFAAVSWAMAAVPAHAATVVIDSVDTSASQFQPANVTIDVGDTVRWEFDQAATTHTVTSSSSNWSLDESRAPSGAAIQKRFDVPGTYSFLCKIHPPRPPRAPGSCTTRPRAATRPRPLTRSPTRRRAQPR